MRMSRGQSRLLRRTDPAFQTLNEVIVEFSTPRGGKASIRWSDYWTISSARRGREGGMVSLRGLAEGLGPCVALTRRVASLPPTSGGRGEVT